jgi:hypothetical protein
MIRGGLRNLFSRVAWMRNCKQQACEPTLARRNCADSVGTCCQDGRSATDISLYGGHDEGWRRTRKLICFRWLKFLIKPKIFSVNISLHLSIHIVIVMCVCVGGGTLLLAARSRVRFPISSLDFCLALSFHRHSNAAVDSASNRNEYQESSWGVKGVRHIRLNITALWASMACYRDGFTFYFLINVQLSLPVRSSRPQSSPGAYHQNIQDPQARSLTCIEENAGHFHVFLYNTLMKLYFRCSCKRIFKDFWYHITPNIV